MATQNNQFSNGKMGSAITVRLAARSNRNEIDEILDDGTIKIRLKLSPADRQVNDELINFLADLLGIPGRKIDIIAGQNGKDKLITILDMDTAQVQEKIFARLAGRPLQK